MIHKRKQRLISASVEFVNSVGIVNWSLQRLRCVPYQRISKTKFQLC